MTHYLDLTEENIQQVTNIKVTEEVRRDLMLPNGNAKAARLERLRLRKGDKESVYVVYPWMLSGVFS